MNHIKNFKRHSLILEDTDIGFFMPGAGEQRRFWEFVDKANWKSDHDYDRIKKLLNSDYDPREIDSISNAFKYYMEELDVEYKPSRLSEPGLGVGDDGWMDLRGDVIGRGKEFFENITEEKLREMGTSIDYAESFVYSFS